MLVTVLNVSQFFIKVYMKKHLKVRIIIKIIYFDIFDLVFFNRDSRKPLNILKYEKLILII